MMAEEFMDDRIPVELPQRDREPVCSILVGSRQSITNIIHTLYALDFAQLHEWSELTPEPNSHRFMSILTKYLNLSESSDQC